MSDAADGAILLARGSPKPYKAPLGFVSAPRFSRFRGCPLLPDEGFWPPLLPILVQPVRWRDAAALYPSPGPSTSSPLPPQPDFQPQTSSYAWLPCCWRGWRHCQPCLQQEGLESNASILRIFFFPSSLSLFNHVSRREVESPSTCVCNSHSRERRGCCRCVLLVS